MIAHRSDGPPSTGSRLWANHRFSVIAATTHRASGSSLDTSSRPVTAQTARSGPRAGMPPATRCETAAHPIGRSSAIRDILRREESPRALAAAGREKSALRCRAAELVAGIGHRLGHGADELLAEKPPTHLEPRLRAGVAVEQQLIDDATSRGWDREVDATAPPRPHRASAQCRCVAVTRLVAVKGWRHGGGGEPVLHDSLGRGASRRCSSATRPPSALRPSTVSAAEREPVSGSTPGSHGDAPGGGRVSRKVTTSSGPGTTRMLPQSRGLLHG